MSFRTALLAVADRARAIAGPTGVDIRTNTLTIRTRTWSGSTIKLGTATDSDLVLAPIYPIRDIASVLSFDSSGQFEVGDLLVDHITPYDGVSVGYTSAQLKPVVTTLNVEIIYIITGPHAGNYTCIDLNNYRPFTYQLILRRNL